jgi:asparagine synthase (glutamine-hydrolysing)
LIICGIAGIWRNGFFDGVEYRLQQMITSLGHRGPDGRGVYHDHHMALGHTRLAIMDLSEASAQPFYDPSGRYVLVYNGEIYNYKEIAKEITGFDFVTHGDTELVMAAFCKWGIACVERFNGIFAFAIWDKVEQVLSMARDRMGVKPLYYATACNIFVFASEVRALLASGFVAPEVDRASVYGYLQYQSAGYPGSIVKCVQEISPGHYAKLSRNGFESVCYWKPTTIPTDHQWITNPQMLKKHLFSLISDAVSSRMVAAVPAGIFLSGGMDSSAILALMSLHSQSAINTFTLRLEENGLDESHDAAAFAAACQANHHIVSIHPDDCLEQVSAYLRAMDSPSMDGLNTFIISSAAKKAGMRVMLSGLGGDELFAGYPGFRYAHWLQRHRFSFDHTGLVRKGLSALVLKLNLIQAPGLSKILLSTSHAVSDCYPSFRQVMFEEQLRQFTRMDFTPSKMVTETIQSFDVPTGSYLTSLYSRAEYTFYASKTLLRDNDQMGMANALEIREPFFDHRLVAFILGLPDELKLGSHPKQLLMDTLYPLLPAGFNRKPKKGFVLPMQKWMRGPLQELCNHAICTVADRDFINRQYLLDSWQNFLKGDKRVSWTTMWLFVVLGEWLEKNNCR